MMQISDQWKNIITQLNPNQPDILDNVDALNYFLTTPTLRIIGPKGMNPTLDFELQTLVGIEIFTELEYLFISHHQIEDLLFLKNVTKLKSLFVHDNALKTLDGIEHLADLTTLYAHNNDLASIEAINRCVKLTEFSCANNRALPNFEGLDAKHADVLQHFYGFPNPQIPLTEIKRVEDHLGIRIRRG